MINFKAEVVMVVTAEDKVDTRHLLGDFSVPRHPHVGQCDDQRAPIFLSKLLSISCSRALVLLVDKVTLKVGEAGDPFFLTDTDEANFATSSLDDG